MSRPFWVEDLRIDVESRTISSVHQTRRIDRQALRVLEVLAARPGSTVGRDELLTLAWAGRVVTDDVLTAAVSRLRRAMGEDASQPRHLQTIPRQGYRLTAGVSPYAPRSGRSVPRRGWVGRARRPLDPASTWDRLDARVRFATAAATGALVYVTLACGLGWLL